MSHINNRIEHYKNQYNNTVAKTATANISQNTLRLLQFNRTRIKFWKGQRRSNFLTNGLGATATVATHITNNSLRDIEINNHETVSYEHPAAQ